MTVVVHRRTKIVATIGPGSENAETIGRLVQAGVDVFRLNFSHGNADTHAAVDSSRTCSIFISAAWVAALIPAGPAPITATWTRVVTG